MECVLTSGFGEMDIISVFETDGGSSILSSPAKTFDVTYNFVYNYCVAVTQIGKAPAMLIA